MGLVPTLFNSGMFPDLASQYYASQQTSAQPSAGTPMPYNVTNPTLNLGTESAPIGMGGPLQSLINQTQGALTGSLSGQNYLGQGQAGNTFSNILNQGSYFEGGPQSNAINFLTQNAPFAESNPYLQSFMQAQTQPLIQQFQEQVIPGLRDSFSQAGQYGSSRQGIAEGIASRGLADAISRSNLGLASQGYGQGLQAMLGGLQLGQSGQENALNRQLSGLALGQTGATADRQQILGAINQAPDIAKLGLLPSQIVGAVGEERQNQVQNAINDLMSRYGYYQGLPQQQLSNYVANVSGVPTGAAGTTSTSVPVDKGSFLGDLAGAAGQAGTIYDVLQKVMGPGGSTGGFFGF